MTLSVDTGVNLPATVDIDAPIVPIPVHAEYAWPTGDDDLTVYPPKPELPTDAAEQLADLSAYPHPTYRVESWETGGYDTDTGAEDFRVVAPLDESHVVSSRILDDPDGRHTVMIDLDVPARLVPSTTAGHGHLYIDVPVTQRELLDLLKHLADLGIVEDGYASVARMRKAAHLRLPWVRKVKP